LLLRREKRNSVDPNLIKLRSCLDREYCIHLVGPILQEILDGVKKRNQFDLLVEYFEPFPLIECDRTDYLEAARLKNLCRNKGIQASSVDFLISSVCINRKYSLLTADNDFIPIAKFCTLALYGQ
jgi:hypothetical protein